MADGEPAGGCTRGHFLLEPIHQGIDVRRVARGSATKARNIQRDTLELLAQGALYGTPFAMTGAEAVQQEKNGTLHENLVV